MKIVIDDNMPYALELFSRTGKVISVPGRYLSEKEINEADGLMVRSVTKINKDFLKNTKIKFVGTATSGIDHIDTTWLRKSGITFSAAPGCNAIAVVEYVFSALLLLAERKSFQLTLLTVGIIGLGNIGSKLKKRLMAWGVKTLTCDPPRADNGEPGNFFTLEELIKQSDVITLHLPLYKEGKYKSLHLINKELLLSLKKNTILINTSRGSIVDNKALLEILQIRHDIVVVLDVWEDEPNFSIDLLDRIEIATTHIAGHSLEGKTRGTIQIFEAWTNFLGKPQTIMIEQILPPPTFSYILLNGQLTQNILKSLVHLIYNVYDDDAIFRNFSLLPNGFDDVRKQCLYKIRREWSSLKVICNYKNTADQLIKLGFTAEYHSD
ncbi:4-phosphoerythronate dehydrogenase [Candidatus Ishikawella capsulata]|uniref:Erythronate-4-phosphate dehydrogenase n=1 Tax=Candidatus Ishikawaella capsulata Mpkobe TaxID=476281 RepID=C5WCA8_9ENTR|nr:4-phosphoerythronate dehydrogenase [Candidatus Ishikawaella capsulata]BAH82964.1 erythronate-4-phosphate dehydrogenase [Candidatus Ishikawaella capsulata Mpkobe]